MFLSLAQTFLPATCLALFFIYAVVGKKKEPGISLLILLAIATVCFTLDSQFLSNESNQTLRIVSFAIAILFVPLLWCIFESSAADSKFSPLKVIGVAAPIVVFVVCIIVVFLTPAVGLSLSPSSSSSIVSLIIICFLFAELLFIIFYIIKNLFVKEGYIRKIFFLFIPISILTFVRVFPISNVVICSILNAFLAGCLIVLVSFIFKIEFSSSPVLSAGATQSEDTVALTGNNSVEAPLEEVEHDQVEEDEVNETEEGEQDSEIPDEPVAPLSEAAENTLRFKFESYLIDGQKFLLSGITMGDVAKDLSTNRTYISQLVNQTYGMTFPEFLNNLRIDYAEQYILHNRNASQQEIAKACGFPSASSFNVTFKKITGVTPRIWLATYSEKNQ